jgi:hypothetical protein
MRASMAELMHRRQQAEQGLDAARNAGDEEQRLDALARGDHLAAKMGRAKLCGLLIDRREDVTRRPTRDPDAPAEVAVEVWLREVAPPSGEG